MQDEPYALSALQTGELPAILADAALWGVDLHTIPGFAGAVTAWYDRIAAMGVKACVKELGA